MRALISLLKRRDGRVVESRLERERRVTFSLPSANSCFKRLVMLDRVFPAEVGILLGSCVGVGIGGEMELEGCARTRRCRPAI